MSLKVQWADSGNPISKTFRNFLVTRFMRIMAREKANSARPARNPNLHPLCAKSVLDPCGSCVLLRERRLILKVLALFSTRVGVRIPLSPPNY
jgi:hypothetical protein